MKKSFGLIEVVVSVGVIAMVLGALLGLSNSSGKLTESSERRLKAVYLAREGANIVRQIHDTSHINNPSSIGISTGVFSLDNSASAPGSLRSISGVCPTGQNFVQSINEDGTWGLTGCDNSTNLGSTGYGRWIDISNPNPSNPDLYKVQIMVEWREGQGMKNVWIRDYLTKWW